MQTLTFPRGIAGLHLLGCHNSYFLESITERPVENEPS
jgi:hypothetical protein